MTGKIVIDAVRPRTPTGAYPAKAVVGESVRVSADIFKDGHDLLAGRVRWRPCDKKQWAEADLHPLEDDRWEAVIEPTTLGRHEFVIEAWTDEYRTWRHKVTAKHEAGQEIDLELEEGALLVEAFAKKSEGDDRKWLEAAAGALRNGHLTAALAPEVAEHLRGPLNKKDVTTSAVVPLWVDRERALVGAWYEIFPRSEGGFRGAAKRLPAIAAMGFDVVYLPPVHPIGVSFRKGRNNTLTPAANDPGSPWAIGSAEGGHTAIHPDLGTFDDFAAFVHDADANGMEVALDYALQCSPDHPWVTEHPEWFHHRPDGSIAYAENP
ncbi:MAG: hypothetical protein QOG03_2651, partial [Actinomycetota bacterium]|nr:hypothetical protein [Actinomycetota bacterium]